MTSEATLEEDWWLLARIARWDEHTLDTLYVRYRRRLRVYLWLRLRGADGANLQGVKG